MKLQDAIKRAHLLMTSKLKWETDNPANRNALRVLLASVRRQAEMRQIPDADVALLREAEIAIDRALGDAPSNVGSDYLFVAKDRVTRVLKDAETNGVASLGQCKSARPYNVR